MRPPARSLLVLFICASALAQSPPSDDALLSKTRALYDAPFTTTLVSFDCAVQFDWKNHFVETLGPISPAASWTLDHLKPIQHRVFVDRSGATISEIPKIPDLTKVPHGADLERTFEAMVSSGLNAWLPFSTNVILPVRPTTSAFKKDISGYTLTMSGTDISATLTLAPDLRILSGVSRLPQPLRFETTFIPGPNGYLLQSLKTTPDITATNWSATFGYTYQAVQEFQLPSIVTVKPAMPETWHYSLTDCKVVTGIPSESRSPAR